MPPRTFAIASLALLALLPACANQDRDKTDEAPAPQPIGWSCLGRVGEVRDDPLHPAAPAQCRIGVLAALRAAGRAMPVTAVVDRGGECRSTERGLELDLAPRVVARFHAAFDGSPGYVPLADSPACPSLDAAQPTLPGGSAALLEIATVATVPATSAAGVAYRLPATVTGRLVEARIGRLLWLETCRTNGSELQAATTFPDDTNLARMLDAAADACARTFATALGAPPPL